MPQYNILAQYVKDISFESPHGPIALPGRGTDTSKDNLAVDFDATARQRTDREFEVVLRVHANFTHDERSIWLLEMTYAGFVQFLEDAPRAAQQELLLIDVPGLLFPFMRQLVAEVTQTGGYPPLYLHPVNFRTLYEDRIVTESPESATS